VTVRHRWVAKLSVFKPPHAGHDASDESQKEDAMAKVLVLYYSAYGHVETMAEAIAEGARAAGATADVKRVPELVPEEVARNSHYKLDQTAPIATVGELVNYDAIVVGVGTRYGRMASQMSNFWDQTGGLWATGALNGKVGAAFTSTASQHGGQETTLFSIITNLMHEKVVGGAPYGATTIAGGDGSRAVGQEELDGARYLGKRVAEVATKLHG
jgi:NAD(P)H dehydrogenase (quinone)